MSLDNWHERIGSPHAECVLNFADMLSLLNVVQDGEKALGPCFVTPALHFQPPSGKINIFWASRYSCRFCS